MKTLLRFSRCNFRQFSTNIVLQKRDICPIRRLQCLSSSKHTIRPISSSSVCYNVISSPHDDVQIPSNVHLAEYVMQDFDRFGQSVAMVDGITEQSYTYAELKDRIVSVASGLQKRGFKQGDILALYSPNVPDYATALLGTALAGGTLTTANPQYTAEELGIQLQRSGAKILVAHPGVLENALKAAAMADNVKEVFVFGEGHGQTPYSVLLEDDRQGFNDNISVNTKEDLAALPYSSGTTGLPKGVMLTHYNIIANIQQLRDKNVTGYVQDDRLLAVLPFFHIYGQVVLMLTGLRTGCKIVTVPKFEPEIYLQCVQNHKISYLHVAPPLAIFLAKHSMVDKYDLRSIHTVFTAAAPLLTDLGQELHNKLKFRTLKQGYGLTETSPVTHCNPMEDWKYGSIGVAIPNTEYKVVDTGSGELLLPNQEGELCVRGPQVMKGYAGNAEATAKTIKDGWLHTGDLGYYDKDGHVVISDRLKELIKYKGFQVAPAELEGLLLTHPAVQDAAVIGLPDERAGELPKAYVVLKPEASSTVEDIVKFVEEKVSPHKRLRGGVEFLEEIPKSASGKILRRLLKKTK